MTLTKVFFPVSVITFCACTINFYISFSRYVEYISIQWWLQLVIIANGAIALYVWMKNFKSIDNLYFLIKKMPFWVAALGIIVVLSISIEIPHLVDVFKFGVDANGNEIYSKHWYEQGGKYFLEINRRFVYEITKTEFEKLNNDLGKIFSSLWFFFSYLVVVIVKFEANNTPSKTDKTEK